MAKTNLEERLGRELRDERGRRIPPYLHRYCVKRFSASGKPYYITRQKLRSKRRYGW